MANRQVGLTDQSFLFRALNLDGTPNTALVYNTTDLVGYYIISTRPFTKVPMTLVEITDTSIHTDNGFIAVNATDGIYRLDVPDVALVNGAPEAIVGLEGVSSVLFSPLSINLQTFEEHDTTSIERLVNADEAASPSSVSTAVWSETERGLTEEVTANVVAVLGTALSETIASSVADAMSYFFDIETPTKTANDVGVAGTSITAEDVRIEMDSNSTQLASIVEDTGTTLPATLATLATPADVNEQVLDVLNVDTFAEPAQGTPSSTTTLINKIGLIYKSLINKKTVVSGTENIYNSDGVTIDHTSTIADDGTTATKGSLVSGS